MLTRDSLTTRLMIGMEIHVELATRSKMWTAAPNIAHRDYYDAGPNSLTDPVVLGLPGTLPVMNKAALEMAMLVGTALNCTIADRTKWDRKSYYYPDLPKNYQISQYDMPLCSEGWIDIPIHAAPESERGTGGASDDERAGLTKRIRILRAHLEEDAGKLLHEAPADTGTCVPVSDSLVDLNRAGTPLLEIVTYPDLTSPDEAVALGQALRDICRHLGVCEGVMQRGHMRFEPNINVIIEASEISDAKSQIPNSKSELPKLYKTPIVEIKNLNSFRALHDAIAFEYDRQIEECLETGTVMASGSKSTRGWDDVRQITVLQREKEEAHDYRYFPDPDLVMLHVDDVWRKRISDRLPELPLAKRKRYIDELKITAKDADALISDPALTRFFEDVLKRDLNESASEEAGPVDPPRIAAMLLNYGAKRANELGVSIAALGITPGQVSDIASLLSRDEIGSSAADELFGRCCDSANRDKTAHQLAKEHDLLQVSDTRALEAYVERVLADPKNAKAVADIQAGKGKAIGALLGQIMKLSKGQANPKLVGEMIRKRLAQS